MKLPQKDTTMRKTTRLPRRTRAMLSSFAAHARTLADACERASKGKATPSDRQLIRDAWNAAGHGKSQYAERGLVVGQDAETGVHSDAWGCMMDFFGVELATVEIWK